MATNKVGRIRQVMGAVVDVHAAARLGMFEKLQQLVSSDPNLVHARGGDGQTPLHFASTVEIAAYLLSEALGWGLVPATAPRAGPYGEGSLQLFVPADFRQHYFTLLEQAEHREALQRICLFDLVVNNADRKSGHCLYVPDDRIYAIDNGLTFHAESKLRTVIWDFGEEPIAAALLDDVRRVLDNGLPPALADLLDPDEQRALKRRARGLLRSGRFPVDQSGLRYPWPLI